MSFEIIDSQEKLDAIVKERLDRQKKQFEGYMSPSDVQSLKDGYEEKLSKMKDYEGYTSPNDLASIKTDYQTKIDALTNENSSLKLSALKQDVAYEYKIPRDMASRLKGETKEEIQQDASTFAKYMGSSKTVVTPLAEPSNGADGKAEIKNLLSQLKG